ncbi:MAG: hypothetical protein KDI32_13465 [Pseudomonadales bacterium]|jgi:uncharacterized lipoprotein YehR (DUF1307 family)|nr:hypothetical protein [Pseudomonadales bacterium]
MNMNLRTLFSLGVASIALAACGDSRSLSGTYVGDVMGTQMAIHFIDDSKATFGPSAAGENATVDCTYQEGDKLITLNCLGSSGITLTRADGGLEANMGGLVVHYKKQ